MREGSTLIRQEDGKVFTVTFLSHWSDLVSEDGEKVSVKLYGFANNGPEFTDELRVGTHGGTYLLVRRTERLTIEEEARRKDDEAIAEGEARYRESVLADEIGIGYANPDYLDSSEDFEGDDL